MNAGVATQHHKPLTPKALCLVSFHLCLCPSFSPASMSWAFPFQRGSLASACFVLALDFRLSPFKAC